MCMLVLYCKLPTNIRYIAATPDPIGPEAPAFSAHHIDNIVCNSVETKPYRLGRIMIGVKRQNLTRI